MQIVDRAEFDHKSSLLRRVAELLHVAAKSNDRRTLIVVDPSERAELAEALDHAADLLESVGK